jgi:hypothetical protein
MPLDFPNSPTNGQIFTSGIKKWTYSTAEQSWLAKNVIGDNYLTSATFTGTNQSLAANGWQKLPGGLIIQWGSTANNVGNNNNSYNVSFPTSFSSVYSVVIGTYTSDGNSAGVGAQTMAQLVSWTNSGFTWFADELESAGTKSIGIHWVAIGT